MPTVSVIIPVYNAERYVADAIQSVLDQTFTDFELLVVDDGSTDQSGHLCRQFSDPRITILRQENRGLAGARNTGIRASQETYVAFLDADDRWLPQKLERHVEHLRSAPEVGVSFSHSALIGEDGRPLGAYQMPRGGPVSPQRLLLSNPLGNGSTAVVRRAVLDDIAFYDDGHLCFFDEGFRAAQGTEDLDCWLRIRLQTSWTLACLPEVLTLYRLHETGLSANGREMLRSWELTLQKTRAYAPEIIDRWETPARARLLRHLASRAVRARDERGATYLIHRALRTQASLLWTRPRETGLTLLAAYALRLLPRAAYRKLEHLALEARKRKPDPSHTPESQLLYHGSS